MQFDKTPTVIYKFTPRGVERIDGAVISETRWTLYVNRQELVTFMCTPSALHHLALGFCLNEGLIESLADVQALRVYEAIDRCYCLVPALGLNETLTMHVCDQSVGAIDLRLKQKLTPPSQRILTAGCGGGVTFDDLASARVALASARQVPVEHLFELMRMLNQRAALYRAVRGVHTSLLETLDGTLLLAEDIGRHNTLDKLRGECLLKNLETRDGILVTSGRISSEMLSKAARLNAPIVVSRTSPTWLSVQLAEQWNIAVVGYTRGNELSVYTHPERILPSGAPRAQRSSEQVSPLPLQMGDEPTARRDLR